MSIVIAVDGTAASGKGTLARRLAAHYGFAHLDSGVLYRLTALSVLEANGDPKRLTDAVKGAQAIDFSRAGDPKLRREEVGIAASEVAGIVEVREALLDFQQSFLAHPPGGSHGAVMDGRDIGTVICPNATAKLYVDAHPEIRAHRRWMELKAMGIIRKPQDILDEITRRDAQDKSRAISPLVKAQDADLLDTSNLGIDAAFAEAIALVAPKVEGALKDYPRG